MNKITTTGAPRSVEEWQQAQARQRSQIAALPLRDASRRSAELILLLEKASRKIDRFGWGQMNKALKAEMEADWCNLLGQYLLSEVEEGIHALFTANKGKLRSINEYQVQEQIRLAHRALLVTLPKKPPEPPRKPITPEELEQRRVRAAEIMAEAGLSKTAVGLPQTAEESQ